MTVDTINWSHYALVCLYVSPAAGSTTGHFCGEVWPFVKRCPDSHEHRFGNDIRVGSACWLPLPINADGSYTRHTTIATTVRFTVAR